MVLWLCGCLLCVDAQRVITVDEMFGLADKNSKVLKPFLTNSEEAEQAIKEAKNGKLPDINLQLSVSYLGDGTITDRDFSNVMRADIPHFGNTFYLEASQVVFAGGAIDAGIRLAELASGMASLEKEKQRQQVRMLLIGQYLDLYKLYNSRKVYEKNIALTEKLLSDIRNRLEQGVALKTDVTRYELQLSSLQLQLTRMNNSIDILNRNLTTAIGLEGQTILPDTTLTAQSLPLSSSGEWDRLTSNSSLALHQASLQIDMEKQQRRIAHAQLLPSVALVASNHLDGPVTIDIPAIDKNFNYWYVGVGMKYQISSLFKTKQSLRKSDFAIQRAVENLDNAQEQTSLAIKEAYSNYTETYTVRQTQEKNVELAQSNYDVVKARYLEGMALISDMLDASNALLDAELGLENAKISTLFCYYKMKFISNTL